MSSDALPSAPLLRLGSMEWSNDQRSLKRAAPSGCAIVGSPGAFFQVPRVDLARRAGKKDEDAVLRGGAERDVRRGGAREEELRIEHVGEPRRDEAGGADLHEAAAGETGTEREAGAAVAVGTIVFLLHGIASIEQKLETVDQRELQILGLLLQVAAL